MVTILNESSPSHPVELWERLYREHKPVGFKRQLGSTLLYSKDGYGWSGTHIPHDGSRRQIPLALFRTRVFHGDVVCMPPFSGAQEITEQVLVLSDSNAFFSYDPKTDRLQQFQDLWPPPSLPRARRLVGPLEAQSKLLIKVEEKLKHAEPSHAEYAIQLALLTLSIVAGLLASAGLQWTGLGAIGPVMTAIGAVIGGTLFWTASRKRDWNRLSRQKMLKMGAQCGLILLTVGCAIAYAKVSGMWGMKTPPEQQVYFVAYGGLGFFCGLISTWIGAELVAWRTGGFSDEQKTDLGFRHSS